MTRCANPVDKFEPTIKANMITQLSADEPLELDIEATRQMMLTGRTAEVRSLACKLMTALIASRSERRVRQMEAERGLSI